MKIPKYVRNAVEMRTKYAYKLMDCCEVVDNYLEKIGIDINSDDFFECAFGHVEIYCNPKSAEKELMRLLERYEK